MSEQRDGLLTSAAPRPCAVRTHQFHGLLPGPRLIVLGAVHGNETCGTQAISALLADLDAGCLHITRGTLTLVPVANPLAYAQRSRQGERNLNRRLRPEPQPREYEDHVANVLCPLLAAHDVLLDLHSFHTPGEPFAMLGPEDNTGPLEPFAHAAQEAAWAAHLGPRRFVEGWLDTYAAGVSERRARASTPPGSVVPDASLDAEYGVGTTEYMRSVGGYGITLECGQHDDPAGVAVGLHAIRQTLAWLKMADLPLTPPVGEAEVMRLVSVTDCLHPGDRLAADWRSFDPVQSGQPIGWRHDGTPVCAPQDGWVVFPNPGAQPGQEWFYFARRSTRRLG